MKAATKRQAHAVRVQAVHQVREGVNRSEIQMGGRRITPRQVEVLQAIADGSRNEDLAAKFKITLPGVQKYVGQIMELTGTTSRASAVAFAIRNGLIK